MPLVASKHLGISTSLPIGTIAEVSKGLKTSNIPSLPARLSRCMPCRPTTLGRFAALPSGQGGRWLYHLYSSREWSLRALGRGDASAKDPRFIAPYRVHLQGKISGISGTQILPALVGRAANPLWPYPRIPKNTLKYVKMVVLITLKVT